MLKHLNTLILATTLILSACATHKPAPVPLGPTIAQLTFQNGQTATIKLDGKHPELETAFQQWAANGTYTQTPVYRQLPGIFILTGKPRLASQSFQPGAIPTPLPDNKKPAATGVRGVGLVVHQDGSVGPELILHYGPAILNCCDFPANIRIGTIQTSTSNLATIQRGDNLQSLTIQP